MLKSRNSMMRRALAICMLLLVSIMISGCGLIDLRPISYTLHPSQNGTIVERNEVLWIEFAEGVDKIPAQRCLAVSSDKGAVSGDLAWEGNRLLFKPAPPLTAGLRYRFSFTGTVSAENGRTERIDTFVDFSAVRSVGAPEVVEFLPLEGSSQGIKPSVTLVFSEAMDRSSVERAFVLSPPADCDYSWTGDSSVAASPQDALEPLTQYTWRIGSEAHAVDGAPLAFESSGTFRTNLDETPPFLLRAAPAVFASGTWDFLSPEATLADLDFGQSILFSFSETVDDASARNAISFKPAIRGSFERLAATSFVYRIHEAIVPERLYTLVMDTQLKDSSGIHPVVEYREEFTSAARYLRVLRVSDTVGLAESAGMNCGALSTLPPLLVGVIEPDGSCSLEIEFSDAFTADAKIMALSRIGCEAWFPAGTLSPKLFSASWPSDTVMRLLYGDFSVSTPGKPRYYKLTLPGASSGMQDGSGHFFKEDAWLYLETKP